jgi:hypothetical protein
MATLEVEQAVHEHETEQERVLRWRITELHRAGYTDRLAFKLGLRRDVDLHRAVELVRLGCSPETAARILL